jgi:hypothetical protein
MAAAQHREQALGQSADDVLPKNAAVIGELTMDLEILRTAARLRPTTPGTSDE